ncbi:hypothetical protein JTE90_001321 [Oedothorax gibbosus]|uniref:Uncharacterized protein n=1 Tax=Oedothorax gibbosus TaxID=931172 RepID=A0AAV6U2N9_9ARAC|nr:hypothetical protein JTE90_001321 [Oedothorax gibbosus]
MQRKLARGVPSSKEVNNRPHWKCASRKRLQRGKQNTVLPFGPLQRVEMFGIRGWSGGDSVLLRPLD